MHHVGKAWSTLISFDNQENVKSQRLALYQRGITTTEMEKPWFSSWPSEVPRKLLYPDVSLHEILQKTAREHPEKIAIAYRGCELTYKNLDTLSNKFAGAMAALAVRKGDKVALFLPNIPQFIIAYYGALKAGTVITAISPLHREREVEYQLNDSGAETVVTLDSLYPIVANVWGKTQLKHGIVTSLESFASKAGENLKVHSFLQLLEKNSPNPPNVKISPSADLAALQYTGGTTGTAKGAMLTHRNLVANTFAFASWIRGTIAKETFLTALPLFHIYGMTTSMNVPISLAAKMVLIPRFETTMALTTIQKQKVTVFCGVPTMFAALLANPNIATYDLASIRVFISGASPLPPHVQRRFMEVTGGFLGEGYGLTEASPVTHCNPVDRTTQTVRLGSIGLPLPDTDACILDLETGKNYLEPNATGELAVRGPQVMKGYWKRPQDTALVLRDGWLLTGDIGRMDREGYFYITDRKKDLIKYKDFSVYPREIEDVLYEHPAVKLCAVVGEPDPDLGEIPKAYIVLKEGAKATSDEIVRFVEEKVASYKRIREVEFRKELPISSAGKVLKRILRKARQT